MLKHCDNRAPDALAEDLLRWGSVSMMQYDNYVQLGTATADVELDTANIVDKAVAALRVVQADIRAKAQKECTDVEQQIQQLLVIENKPTVADHAPD